MKDVLTLYFQTLTRRPPFLSTNCVQFYLHISYLSPPVIDNLQINMRPSLKRCYIMSSDSRNSPSPSRWNLIVSSQTQPTGSACLTDFRENEQLVVHRARGPCGWDLIRLVYYIGCEHARIGADLAGPLTPVSDGSVSGFVWRMRLPNQCAECSSTSRKRHDVLFLTFQSSNFKRKWFPLFISLDFILPRPDVFFLMVFKNNRHIDSKI